VVKDAQSGQCVPTLLVYRLTNSHRHKWLWPWLRILASWSLLDILS
jgi:hypothetical protein